MRPLISYYGGKQRIASKVLQFFPPHTVYVEPFAGGAALLFAKPKKEVTNTNHYREVLNDKNKLIVTLYKVAREYPDELQLSLQLTPYSKSEHQWAMQVCKNPNEHSSLEVARCVVINCNQSFGNGMYKGWRYGLIGRNDAQTWTLYLKSLPLIFERLSGVYVECDDALKIIKKWDSPQTLFYCDPPYVGTDQGHYSGYKQKDFDRLLYTLNKIQGSFVLSCYENESLPKNPKVWERFEIKTVMSAAKSDNSDKSVVGVRSNIERTELIYRKISRARVRDDLVHLMTPTVPEGRSHSTESSPVTVKNQLTLF